MKKLTQYVHAIAADIATGGPWATSSSLVADFHARKGEESREILLDELAHGRAPVEPASQDDAISITLRVQEAHERGCARAALRLLAAVLNGLGEQGPVYASDFARYQKILADLSREEIILLATILRHYGTGRDDLGQPVSADGIRENVAAELVPKVFRSERHVNAFWASVQRTGLLMQGTSIDDVGAPMPSPLLFEIAELASFENVLRREGETI
ncbi:hypothetical protein CKO28_16480 [Rhodovibrio sodomensis]|uniref:Uncharacterized protein n=1 Tax=Rhodovibrio sodomensis TaxID=1088 RepID=A0ABS1DI06_9PROT|nr:hypothetical protein [Rhodovibrio sodomensis]MBK1669636.1 hypothetical protein [Rhodovibrio sodomensis]